MVGRVILLIAAFVVAGLGALLVFLYAQQADERAAAQFEPVDVLVATREVPAGTAVAAALEAGSFDLVSRPAVTLPDGAVSDPAGTEGQVVLSTLYRNEVLSSSKIGDPGAVERLPIPDGHIAASFTLGDPNRVADFVAPGSKVAVFLTTTVAETNTIDPGTGEPTTASVGQTTRLLLSEVDIIAVGGTTTQSVTTTGPDGLQQTTETNLSLLTLALTQRETEQMVLAQSLGELYLGLLSDTSVIEQGRGVTADDLFEAVSP
jgi:pilus assembly protein CpaB